jgi:hypothetical protein
MKSDLSLFCVLGVTLALVSCASFPTAREAGLSLATTPIDLPGALDWGTKGQAHELIQVSERMVVIGAGDHPISDAAWPGYQPPPGYQKNIERNLLFTRTAFLHSPGVADSAVGSERYRYRTFDGLTWLELAQPVAIDFIPEGQATDLIKPAPGHLVVKTILKPQVLEFTGAIWQLSDGKGDLYVMHATETGVPTPDVVLPPGWTVRRVELEAPLVIRPLKGGYYNIVGDCLGQGYHQYAFAGPTYP